MRRIRLLPVVIFAALALLVFKGIGIVTNGGFVLTGPMLVAAEDGGGETMSLPSEAVVTDTSPVMADMAPSMAARETSSAPAEPASSQAADAHGSTSDLSSASSQEMSSSAEAAADACPEAQSSSAAPTGGDINDKIGTALVRGCPPPPAILNEHGDAMPTTKDGNGRIVPLQVAEGDDSQDALLTHLSERRTELDKRQADLDMREALVAAAEQKLDERTKALEALQAQVAALVDQKQAEEDASFKAVVSMYENMKAKDAAKIFDTLDLDVLLKIARAMNPRNMSPILAAMSADPAQKLTMALASVAPITTVPAAGPQNVAALPQIVGK